MNRSEYIEQCRKFIKNFPHPLLVRYYRDKKRHPIGVMVAFMSLTPGGLQIGYSKCNTNLDTWNRHIGIIKAISNTNYENAPYDMKRPLKDFIAFVTSERGKRFLEKK